jgi:hypothetical protein
MAPNRTHWAMRSSIDSKSFAKGLHGRHHVDFRDREGPGFKCRAPTIFVFKIGDFWRLSAVSWTPPGVSNSNPFAGCRATPEDASVTRITSPAIVAAFITGDWSFCAQRSALQRMGYKNQRVHDQLGLGHDPDLVPGRAGGGFPQSYCTRPRAWPIRRHRRRDSWRVLSGDGMKRHRAT